MFGFKKKQKKERKPLMIQAKDVFTIIKSDYDDNVPFCLAEFLYHGQKYMMGSSLIPNAEMRKENILFVFNDDQYETYQEFLDHALIGGVNLSESEELIEITRAGIIDGEELINSPWDDTRLERLAVEEA